MNEGPLSALLSSNGDTMFIIDWLLNRKVSIERITEIATIMDMDTDGYVTVREFIEALKRVVRE